STDSRHLHLAWATSPCKQGGLGPDLRLPLIADRNVSISLDCGVLIEDEGIALRSLFITDPKGIFRCKNHVRRPRRRSVEGTAWLVKAFQFTDEHGEVCPANWSEDAKTTKAGPNGSLEHCASVENGNVRKKRDRTD
ncbi:thioredoxin-like protein, partial [Epithele typhae]|uniref:thioredoxin-like protein n=1 Tax=Epithele typhae TaxID=378194 RepID=UPI002007528D